MKKSKIAERLDDIIWYCLIVYAASDIFSIAVVQISAGTLIVLFLLKKILSSNFIFKKNPLNLPLLLFILARIISIILSSDFNLSFPGLYKEVVFYFVFFVFINEIDISNRQRIKVLLQLIIFSGCAAAIYGMAVYLFINPGRIMSTTSGYYTLGMYLVASLSISLMTGDVKEIFPKRYIWWFVNLILIAGILLTFDRVHWIAMTLAVFLSGIIKERKFVILYVIIIFASFLLFPVLFERLTLAFNQMDFSERGLIWKGAYSLMGKHPVFGFGPGTFREIFPYYEEIWDKGVNNWHNDYIQLYIESGLIGLASYIYLIVIAFKNSFSALKFYKTNEDNFNRTILRGLVLSFTTFLISGFLLDPVTTLLFLLIISLISILAEDARLRKEKSKIYFEASVVSDGLKN